MPIPPRLPLASLPLLLTFALPPLASCAPAPPSDAALAEQVRRLGCGLNGARPWRMPRSFDIPSRPGSSPRSTAPQDERIGSGERWVSSGDAVRACALPTAEEIGWACKAWEGVPIPGSSNPDNPEEPLHAFPDYRVSRVSCGFLRDASSPGSGPGSAAPQDERGPAQSRAECRFDLAEGEAAPRPVEAELIYRYRDLSNNVVHGWHVAQWEMDRSCRDGDSYE